MKQHSKKTATGTAYTKKLDTPLPYEYSWETFENKEEFIEAKAEMTIDEQMKARNRDAANNARNKALNAALLAAGYEKPTIENDDYTRLMSVFKGIMSSKKHTVEKARELASAAVGVEWPEDEDGE